MKFIGITGGVGAGKSEILSYLSEKPGVKVMLADEIAHELMEPGTDCYRRLAEAFAGEDIFRAQGPAGGEPGRELKSGEACGAASGREQQSGGACGAALACGFDRGKLAAVIFADSGKRERLNGIVHPAVKEYVKRVLEQERQRGKLRLLVLEAALLIEGHYDEICDELWYIYTDEAHRRERLMAGRGYTQEKIAGIFASQLDEATYRRYCKRVIDNNGTVEEARRQIDAILAAGV